jgi:peptide/nickel transport system substrate-binding protein
VYPLPSRKWNISSAGGKPINDWATNPKAATAIFDYLNKLGGQVGQFGSALWKMSDGPFTLASYNTTNGSFVLKPNPNYGGSPRPKATVDVNTYTSFTSELNAVRSGSLDIMVGFDPSQIPQMASLKSQGILAYGGPAWGWFAGVPNYQNTTNHFNKVVSQLYVRQALQYLIDEPAIIKGVYKGAAVTSYGPIPSAPVSPYTPQSATHPYYPFSPHKAVALLKSHGWKVVPRGQTTCENPGTTKNECGAGIPKGTPISIVWANQPESVQTVGPLESEAFASEAKQFAGINVSFQTKTLNFLITNYNNANPAAKKYTGQWGVNNVGGLLQNYFPTQEGAWNTTGAFNIGGFSDPVANKLMLQSVFGANPDAVTKEADYFSKHLPVLFFPDQDYMVAVNAKKVGSVDEDGWTTTTQQAFFPQYWFAK